MIRSMTGYGRAEAAINGHNIAVEIKSVNHRYFEFTCRTTRGYAFLDERLKSFVQNRVSRGKIDAYVTVETLEDTQAQVAVNHSLAAGYVNALHELAEVYQIPNDVTVSVLARYSDIFSVHKAPEDEEKVWQAVREVAEKAVNDFVSMREIEGARMKEDVLNRANNVLSNVELIEKRSPQTVVEYQNRLKEKIQELLHDTTVDEQRLLTETAVFADKIAVDEETVRLRSHIRQLHMLLESTEAVGRKLDFLIQEMNREANTIGSKASDSQIAYIVVDIKAEIEKIREQIQNIE